MSSDANVLVAVGLGSNLGDRALHIARAVDGLGGLLGRLRCSAVYETVPEGDPDQPRFLNMCCVGRTRRTPRDVLRRLLELEREEGRGREGDRRGPRTLDLDLLLFGDRVIREAGLEVPHPRLASRTFVLVPLAALVPNWIHPALGVPIAELARRVGSEGVQPAADALPGLLRTAAAPTRESE